MAVGLSAAVALLSACGSGGGGGRGSFIGSGGTGGGGSTGGGGNTGVGTCIQTSSFGCISMERYREEKQKLIDEINATPEFTEQWGLGAIKADHAHAHLWLAKGRLVKPGAGVTVGLIDTGIDQEHASFEGVTITEELLFGIEDEDGKEFSHGTAVASIIAASPNTSYTNDFKGVAWGAAIKMFVIALGNPPPKDVVQEPTGVDEIAESRGFFFNLYGIVLESGVDILNLSFGSPGIIENYAEDEIRDSLGTAIEVMAQADAEEKTIFVWAGGNAHGRACTPGSNNCVGSSGTDHEGNPAGTLNASSVELWAGLHALIEELRPHTVAVVAVNEEGGDHRFFQPLRDRRQLVPGRSRRQCQGRLLRTRPRGQSRSSRLWRRSWNLLGCAHGLRWPHSHEALLSGPNVEHRIGNAPLRQR